MRLGLWATGLVVLLVGAYIVGVVRHPGWSWWRTTVHLVSSALLWWCLAGTPAGMRQTEPIWGVVGVGLANVAAGFGFVAAAPVRLLEEVRGRPVRWLRSGVVRVLAFPLTWAVLNGVLVVGAFASPWFTRALTDDTAWLFLVVACTASGFLANVQLLSPELAWTWLTPGPRMAVALLDGLVDELPGIAVMTMVNGVWGAILWGMVQPVVVPMLVLILVDWWRHDRAEARRVDAELDATEAAGGDTSRPWWLASQEGHPPTGSQ
ncbi:MAG TPA: cytochrome c oxidase assembly protein [Propionibacteriaceae bacterium]|nr:cytochrome c oxidase assembly protein [Propionibacteriaceae bacterium]